MIEYEQMESISGKFAKDLIDCFEGCGKCLIIGNGGSAAMASHFAAELVVHFELKRKALPAIALTTDTSILTAIGNDDGYHNIFTRQIEALGKEGDILFILSTSGKSINCLEAELVAKKMGLVIRQFPLKEKMSTAMCQEKHLKIVHEICGEIDRYYVVREIL